MLEQFFIETGTDYFSNKSGSNLMQGITAEFALNSGITGKAKCKNAIIECDEAASKTVFEYINPKVVLITNIFRDQLGVIGDITDTLNNIKIGVKCSPNAIICLNADDSLSSSIVDELNNKIVYFGVNTEIYDTNSEINTEATHCIKCGAEYDYEYVTYGHLGGFNCSSCGYKRVSPDVAVIEILSQNSELQTIKLLAENQEADIVINMPGGYNIYNAAGVVCAALSFGFELDIAYNALSRFEGAFGRMEKFILQGRNVRMILVKNPVAFNQVLNYISSLSEEILLAISLNDHTADGTDISWIWDVAFEKLLDMDDRLRYVLVSGTRREDMALCLKQAGLSDEKIQLCTNQNEILLNALMQDAPVYIVPTYTAMLEIRSVISREFGIKEYWEG
jgi:UDP-N-acetylmuramyl tripeptide synthase